MRQYDSQFFKSHSGFCVVNGFGQEGTMFKVVALVQQEKCTAALDMESVCVTSGGGTAQTGG